MSASKDGEELQCFIQQLLYKNTSSYRLCYGLYAPDEFWPGERRSAEVTELPLYYAAFLEVFVER